METAKGRKGKEREEKTYLSIRCMQSRAEQEYSRYGGKERKGKQRIADALYIICM